MKREFRLHPDYLKKLSALEKVRKDFLEWKRAMDVLEDPTLEKCHALVTAHGFAFPRFVVPNLDFQLRVYRVRTIAADSEEDICDPRTFSYPPVACCRDFQRANAPGHPVFYAAADAKSAMEEIRLNGMPIKAGDKIFLSEWKIKSGSRYALNYLTRPEVTEEIHGYRELTLRLYSEMDRIFSKEDEFFGKQQRLLFELTSSLFFGGSYTASGMIGHQTLYDTPEVNGIRIVGISYPSCANSFRGVNFAFHPDFVDSSFELQSVRLVTFREFNETGAQTTGNYNGIVEANKIKWTCFMVYLKVQEATSVVYLAEDCDQEDVYGSTMIFHDGTTASLQDYTKAQVEKIDLSALEVGQENEKYYISETMMQVKLKLGFEPGSAQLNVNGKLIPLIEMEINVPVLPKVEEVSPTRVLAKLSGQ